jgi:hypothetical protein
MCNPADHPAGKLGGNGLEALGPGNPSPTKLPLPKACRPRLLLSPEA